jgi:hypothetical protein
MNLHYWLPLPKGRLETLLWPGRRDPIGFVQGSQARGSTVTRRYAWILISMSLVQSTSHGAAVSPSEREMVMTEGLIITVYPLPHKQVPFPTGGDIPFTGSLQIRAGSGFRRYYTWDGETRWVDLFPREERWRGAYGAYYPGYGSHWRSNHGITRGTLGEAQMHFESVEDAQKWLESKPYAVYSHDGLVVEFSKNSGAGGTLDVHVWQILIRKQKPTMLKGSHDKLISVSR